MGRVLAAVAAREEQCDARKGVFPSRDVLGHEAVARETCTRKVSMLETSNRHMYSVAERRQGVRQQGAGTIGP